MLTVYYFDFFDFSLIFLHLLPEGKPSYLNRLKKRAERPITNRLFPTPAGVEKLSVCLK